MLTAVAAVPAWAQVVPAVRESIGVRGMPLLVEVKVGASAVLPEVAWQGADAAKPARTPASAILLWPYYPQPEGPSLLRWAAPSNPARVTRVRPDGAHSAYLAIEVPADAPESLRLSVGGATVAVAVYESAPKDFTAQLAARASMVAPQGQRDPLLSIPDPRAPFERFRFGLGIAMRGWPAPEPFDTGSADEVAARANEALWMAALARAYRGSPGPVTELAELLVATCSDDTAPAPIAAWIASPEELSSILRLAFEREFTPERLASGINELMRVRSPVLWWIEDSDRQGVTIAFANPTTRAQVVRYQWLAGSETDVVPLVLDVPAAEVRRARAVRPERVRGAFAAQEPDALDRLRVTCGGIGVNIVVPPAVLPTDARGLRIEGCFAPLDLASVSPGSRGLRAERSARLSVRERLKGWEVFVEVVGATDQPGSIRIVGAPIGSVHIDGAGATEFDGVSLDAEAKEYAAQATGFRASFVMPPEWIQREDERTVVEIGFRREVPGGFVDAPFPSVPWRARPRLGAIDLSSP